MSNISVDQQVPWLEEYHPQAFSALQGAITRTDSELDSFITELLTKVNSWKSAYSTMDMQDILMSVFQGRILGVVIPKCVDMLDCDGFFTFITSRPQDFKWNVEYEQVGNVDLGGTQVVTNENLKYWAERIPKREVEAATIETFKDSVHHASSSHVYNSVFRPKSMAGITTGGSTLDYIFETQGYHLLYDVLNPLLPKPNYK